MHLRIQALTKAFHGQVVFDRLDLEVTDVRALVLIGPSGGGKSTLLRILGGLTAPEAGTVTLDGVLLPFREPDALRRYRTGTGFVFQGHNLFPHLTALENVALPLHRVHGIPAREATAQAIALLERFHLNAHRTKRPYELSGGQRQRVAIARAVAVKPKLMLFDEPTSALDPEMTAEVLDMIAALREEGRDLVLVTHQMGFARRVADHVAFVGGGGIPHHGPASAMLTEPPYPLVRQFLQRVMNY